MNDTTAQEATTMNTTTAVRTTDTNGKQVVTITRGDTVIVRKGKAEVRKPYASTCISTTGEIHGFISVNPDAGGDWATDWEVVEITGDPVA